MKIHFDFRFKIDVRYDNIILIILLIFDKSIRVAKEEDKLGLSSAKLMKSFADQNYDKVC